jgi:hypothetical protein
LLITSEKCSVIRIPFLFCRTFSNFPPATIGHFLLIKLTFNCATVFIIYASPLAYITINWLAFSFFVDVPVIVYYIISPVTPLISAFENCQNSLVNYREDVEYKDSFTGVLIEILRQVIPWQPEVTGLFRQYSCSDSPITQEKHLEFWPVQQPFVSEEIFYMLS